MPAVRHRYKHPPEDEQYKTTFRWLHGGYMHRWSAGEMKKDLEAFASESLICLAFLGSSTWARTRDLRINSPALYRLSYRGIQPKSIA